MDSFSVWLATVTASAAVSAAVLAGRDRLVVAWLDHQRRRQLGGHPWRQLSRRLRLRYTAGVGATSHRLDGASSGRVVAVSLRDTESGRPRRAARDAEAYVLTEVTVEPRMPLSSELLFDGTGPEAAEQGLVGAGTAPSRAERVEIGPTALRLSARGVVVSELPALVTGLTALCLALEGRSRAPWRLAARRFGLSSQIVDEERALSGPTVTVRIRPAGAPFSSASSPLPVAPGSLHDPETVIRVAFPPTPGLLLRRRRPADPPGRRLGQPVLDSLLYIESPRPLSPRLRSTAACETLLSVLHAWPGSVAREGAVELRVPGRLGSALPDRIAEASAAAALLGDQRIYEPGEPG